MVEEGAAVYRYVGYFYVQKGLLNIENFQTAQRPQVSNQSINQSILSISLKNPLHYQYQKFSIVESPRLTYSRFLDLL